MISKPLRRSGDHRPSNLIVGLGNPGSRYAKTRHNVGFMCVNRLARRWDLGFRSSSRDRSDVARGAVDGAEVILAQPQTFMNESGQSVSLLCRHHGLEASQLILIYDDLDLPFGTLRIRSAGGAGGHRGVQSIIDHLGTNAIPRIRVGIGRGSGNPVDYVLHNFAPEEQAKLPEICEAVSDIVEFILDRGVEAAMNHFNGSRTTTATP